MRPLNEEEAALAAEQGHDPRTLMFDDSTGEVVVVGESEPIAAPSNEYSLIGESLKEAGQGLLKPIGGVLQFIGRGGEAIDKAMGWPRIGEGSTIADIGDSIESGVEKMLPVDPRYRKEHEILSGVSSGIGQFGGMLLPAGGASRLVRGVERGLRVAPEAALPIASRVASGMSGFNEGADTLQRATDRGDDPALAMSKAIASATTSGVAEKLLGAGRVIGNLGGGFPGIKQLLINRARDGAYGYTEEGLQRAAQELIVEGKIDWNAAQEVFKEAKVGGLVQMLVGAGADIGPRTGAAAATAPGTAPSIDPTTTATDSDDFMSMADADTGDTDVTTTPWKLKPLDDASALDIVQREEWDPVIKTEFDDAIKEAKKRKLLTPDLLKELHKSDKPLQTLDDFVRTPGATGEAKAQSSALRVTKPLDVDQLTALRNIKADDKLPVSTPLLKGVQKLRKAGLTFNDADVQALNRAADDKEADAIVSDIFLRSKLAERPMNAAEAAMAIEKENWEQFGKEYAADTKLVETAKKSLEDLQTQIDDVTAPQSEKWKLADKLKQKQVELNKYRTMLMQKYLAAHADPAMAVMRSQANNPGAPLPAVPMGGPAPTDPSVGVDPFTLNRDRQLLLEGPGGESMLQGANRPAIPMGDRERITPSPAQGDPRQQMSEYAESQGGIPRTPQERLFDLQSQHGIIEGTRIWEGEQGRPFADEADPVKWGEEPADNPDATRSFGLPKELTKYVSPLRYIYKGVASIGSDLASKSPVGAYVAARLQPLFTTMNSYKNKATKTARRFKKFLKNDKVKAFIRESQASNTWDVSKLPAELRAEAAEFRKFLKVFHAIQNRLGIAVWRRNSAGVLIPTKAQDDPGYFPDGIKQDVYDARLEQGDKWRQYKRDYLAYWKKKNRVYAGWQVNAEKALDDIFTPLATPSTVGGQPEFKAVRIQQGMGLPDSWKNEDLMGSIENYVDRWAKDVGWAKVVQKDPVLRKVFGITEDPSGKDTSATDPKTFAQAIPAFREAVRAGRRVEAEWAADPKKVIREPIETLFGNDDILSIINSYRGTPAAGGTRGAAGMNEIQQLTGSMLMQTVSATRDLSNAAWTIWDYIPVQDVVPAARALFDTVLHPIMAVRRGQDAGAIQMDQYAHEASGMLNNWFFRGMRAFTKGVRTVTLRNAADLYAKAIVYNISEGVVKHYARHGMTHSLVKEFGPTDTTGMSPDEVARQTAAAVVDRVQPTYDARSMNQTMLPQNRSFLGAAFGLTRWPLAKYNKWYEDVWVPAKRGENYQRLFKNLFLGTAGAALTQELLSMITDREPQDLTIKEWLKLPDNDKRVKEVLPMLFGYIQAQGTMGILGNLGYQASRLASGKSTGLSGAIQLAYPPAIVYQDWSQKIASFWRAAEGGYVGIEDVADLFLELLHSAQNAKVWESWQNSKPEYRDRRIHEELYGISAETGNSKARDNGPRTYTQDPFSLSKRVKAAKDDPKELRKVMPALVQRALDGSPVRMRTEIMSPLYYAEVANRRGIAEARRQYEADLKREEEQAGAKVMIDAIGDLAPPKMDWR